MSDEREKSVSERKVEEALGIGSNNSPKSNSFDEDLDELSDDIESNEEEERQLAIQKRKDLIAENKNLIKELTKNDQTYDQDENYVRNMLKEITTTGMSMLKLQELEMQDDPSARNAETAASMISSLTSALKELDDVGLKKMKLELEKEKVNLKKSKEGPNSVTNNFIGSGTFADIVRGMKDEGLDIGKINDFDVKDAEAEVVEEPEED